MALFKGNLWIKPNSIEVLISSPTLETVKVVALYHSIKAFERWKCLDLHLGVQWASEQQVWAKSRMPPLVPHFSPHVCEGCEEDLNEGIKNPTGVDSSVVRDAPLWWGMLLMGGGAVHVWR